MKAAPTAVTILLLVTGCAASPADEPERLQALRLEATLERKDGFPRPVDVLLTWRDFPSRARPWLHVTVRDSRGVPLGEERLALPVAEPDLRPWSAINGYPAAAVPVEFGLRVLDVPGAGRLGTIVVGLQHDCRQFYALSRADQLTLLRDEDPAGEPRPFLVAASSPAPFEWCARVTADTLLARVRSPDRVIRSEALWVIAGVSPAEPEFGALDLRGPCHGEALRRAVEALASPSEDVFAWPWEQEAAVAALRALAALAR